MPHTFRTSKIPRASPAKFFRSLQMERSSPEVHMDERKRYEEGMKARRAVLGDAHVDRAQKNRTAFNEPFQDLITHYAWCEIWSRPGLPRKTRSLLNLSMLVALNREPEIRMHLKAALALGITRDEIQEVLLQAAIYCGVPAANSAFHAAEEVFDYLDAKKSG